jgi:hypothetical protein
VRPLALLVRRLLSVAIAPLASLHFVIPAKAGI